MGYDSSDIDSDSNGSVMARQEFLQDRVRYIDDHFHNKERWYGKKNLNNEINAIENNLIPFRIISGFGAYGTSLCVIGNADIPIDGKATFEVHRIFCSDCQKSEIGKVRILWGNNTAIEAENAGNYSSYMLKIDKNSSAINELRMPIVGNGTKVWMSYWSITNLQWLDFFIGVH